MKIRYFIIFLLISLFSCNNREKKTEISSESSLISYNSQGIKSTESGKYYPEVEQRSLIIGQIENFKDFPKESKTIKLFVDDITISQQILFISELNDSGKFVFDIPLYHSTNTYLKYCDGSINPYIFPNDTLYLTCKLSNVGSLIDINIITCDEKHDKFQKSFAEQNYWINKEIKFSDDNLPKRISIQELKTRYFAFEKELHEKIDSRIDNKSSNQLLYNYLRNTATYSIYKDIIRLGKDIENPQERSLFYSFLTDSIIFNKNALITSSYRIFLNNYKAATESVSKTTSFTINKTKEERDQKLITKDIEKKMALTKGVWAEFQAASTIYNSVITKEEEFTASAIDYYLELTLEKITDKYIQQLMLSMLTKAQKAIIVRDNIHIPNSSELKTFEESMPGEKLFNEILAENKGKVIYIDIWATWCSSCIQLFPDAKKLHEMFEGKNVSFVYLCCRSQKEASQNLIKKHQLKGTHYFLDRIQYEYFEKRFLISGIPRFILIDKSGKIISSDAPRPDSEQTIVGINKLIN